MSGQSATSPEAEYQRRHAERAEVAATLARREAALANGRLVVALATLLLAYPAITSGWAWLLLIPVAAFLALVILHDRVIHQRRAAERAAGLYAYGLDRLRGTWQGKGVPGERYRSAHHPSGEDLDLWGRGSLYERLCTARTRAGRDRLAAWLSSPADRETVLRRQTAVRDLAPRLDLREKLAIRGEDLEQGAEPHDLSTWCQKPGTLPARIVRIIALVLGIVAAVALLALAFGGGYLLFAVLIGLELLFSGWVGRAIQRVIRASEPAGRELGLLSRVLAPLETERFDAPHLQKLQQKLLAEGRPSERLAKFERLLGWQDVMRNGVFGVVAWVLQVHVQMAYAVEDWRLTHGKHVPLWMETVAEFEALAALGSYAWENPEDTFPELLDGSPRLDLQGIAHPLLPPDRAIRNDVSLGGDLRLLVVSGSNMSGKSTLLRSIGVNCVLALAGAPVRATTMRLTPVQIGTSLRVSDDLDAGISRFYAEVKRLRQVVELASGPTPLVFLLDEILSGTNSHDRRIGAEAVLRGLVARGAVGLVTTHDLALTEVGEDPALQARNVHFQDEMVEGRMHFDYRLREGVVARSNALALMRAVGLDV